MTTAAESTAPVTAALELENVSFGYDNGLVLESISLRVQQGQFVCLLGPSGCGKSTLLRLLAGLERPATGAASCHGKRINGPGLDRSVVFQDYSLFPWMSLQDNVALAIGKARPDLARPERSALANEYLELVGLGDASTRYPFELSGGMKQRGAIARALAVGSPVLLMDEPFGALDPVNRSKLQELVVEIWSTSEPRRTVVFVTHDIDEALLLADRVLVLASNPGRVLADVSIDLPRPRLRNPALQGARFEALRGEILGYFRAELMAQLDRGQLVGAAEGI